MRRVAILIILAVFFVGYAYSVIRMEHLRTNGRDALFRLAPVDPRALLMGDYMTLEYAVNEAIWDALHHKYAPDSYSRRKIAAILPSEGMAVVRLASQQENALNGRVVEATFARMDDGTPLAEGELLLAFKVRRGSVISASTAYYFQEGHEKAYAKALFGRLKMDKNGKTLLVGLCDKEGLDISVEPKGEGVDTRF